MNKVINDIDHSQQNFKTPLSSEDGRNYNVTWDQRDVPTVSVGEGMTQEEWDAIFSKKEK